MKTNISIQYEAGSCVELPSLTANKNGSGSRKWLGGAFNRQQRKIKKGCINGLKTSSVQPLDLHGKIVVSNAGLWNYIHNVQSIRPNAQEEKEIPAFLQKVPLLDIAINKTQKTDTSENEKNKEKCLSTNNDVMREVLQAKIFPLQFETEEVGILVIYQRV